jgi:hypothetical protein
MPLRSLSRQRSDRSKAAASAVEVVAAALGDGYVKQDGVGSPGHKPASANGRYVAVWCAWGGPRSGRMGCGRRDRHD